MRLSWFISSSYSKSEIARRPLTIAVAPRSAGEVDDQDVERLDADVGQVRGRLLDEARRAPRPRTARWFLRTEALTTATISSSKMHAARRDDVEVAVGDRVVGAGADGDAVLVRCHGCGSGCRRSGVRRWWAGSSSSGRPAVALGHDHAPPGASTGGSSLRQRRPRAARRAGRAGRGRPDRIGAPRARASAEEAQRVRADARSRVGAERLEVGARAPAAAAGARSTNVARAAPRESASSPSAPEPAKRSSTAAPLDAGAEDREQRLAHAVGGRARRRRAGAARREAAGRRSGRAIDPHHAGIGSSASAP